MRKRNIKYLFEKLMWGIIMFMPVIAFLLTCIKTEIGTQTIQQTTVSFNYYMANAWSSEYGIGEIQNVINSFVDMITNNNASAYSGFTWLMAWIVLVEIIHLAVDFLVFIPRLCHKFMDKFCEGEGE